MAELITRNISNQYFITTHNPYFITTILDNISLENVNIYWMDFNIELGVSINKLSDEKVKRIKDLDYDIFYN
ncbi:MAG: hypothetical protein ACTSRZ_01625 [Promethearchaeota archaeon]